MSDTDISEDYDNDPFYQAMTLDSGVPNLELPNEDEAEGATNIEQQQVEQQKLQSYVTFEINLNEGSFGLFVREETTKREQMQLKTQID